MKKRNTVGTCTVPKSNRKIVATGKIDRPVPHLHIAQYPDNVQVL